MANDVVEAVRRSILQIHVAIVYQSPVSAQSIGRFCLCTGGLETPPIGVRNLDLFLNVWGLQHYYSYNQKETTYRPTINNGKMPLNIRQLYRQMADYRLSPAKQQLHRQMANYRLIAVNQQMYRQMANYHLISAIQQLYRQMADYRLISAIQQLRAWH